MLYVPLMSESIYYLLIGILEQVVPLLSLFMGFACWEKDLISGKDILYCQYVSLAKQSCTYGLHFGLNRSHSLNCSNFLQQGSEKDSLEKYLPRACKYSIISAMLYQLGYY